VRLASPFLLRMVRPALGVGAWLQGRGAAAAGQADLFALEPDLFPSALMIAGRCVEAPMPSSGQFGLAAFDFATGTLILTRREQTPASLHLVRARRSWPGTTRRSGPLDADEASFTPPSCARPTLNAPSPTTPFQRHRNAYSDEILHRAGCLPWI